MKIINTLPALNHFSKLAILLAITLCGCGGKVQKPAEIVGTLSIDGKPVPAALLTLQPVEPKKPSIDVAIVDGKFEIPRSKCPMAGQYKVRLTPPEIDHEQLVLARTAKEKGTLLAEPRRVTRAIERSPLENVELLAGVSNTLSFELKTK